MKLLFFACLITVLAGCASSSGGSSQSLSAQNQNKPGRVYMRTPSNYDTRAHPASFVVDRFEVPKLIQEPTDSPVPFYFKTCDRHVGNFGLTNSRYDCDYP